MYERVAQIKSLRLNEFKNNGGGECASASWSSKYPTDSQIVMHFFSQFVGSEKFEKFSHKAELRNQLFKSYKEMGRVRRDEQPESKMMGLLKRIEEQSEKNLHSMSIYSKSESKYEPHFELEHLGTTYPSLPGVYSVFIAIGWFLKLVKERKGHFNGLDFNPIIREVLSFS